VERIIVVTGVSGFIGHSTAEVLLQRGYRIIGIDNMNDYYDVILKNSRLERLKKHADFLFYEADIEHFESIKEIFHKHKVLAVINLAARAGVRYSIENPFVYVTTNTLGTANLLEICRRQEIEKFVLASTSSLYAGQPMPFQESLPVNEPISPYAASKKGAEALGYTYHYLYGLDVTVLRYFTVYGPMGRPDMSYFRFMQLIDAGEPIEIYGDGSQSRDFTYIDDISDGTARAVESRLGYEVINLGGNKPYPLHYLIERIEKCLEKKAKRRERPFHKADMKETWADISRARALLGWNPEIPLEEGIERTVRWHEENREWLRELKL
jgi:nucleoside-diphosphate-sugar epimerase